MGLFQCSPCFATPRAPPRDRRRAAMLCSDFSLIPSSLSIPFPVPESQDLKRWREEYGDMYDLSLLDRKGASRGMRVYVFLTIISPTPRASDRADRLRDFFFFWADRLRDFSTRVSVLRVPFVCAGPDRSLRPCLAEYVRWLTGGNWAGRGSRVGPCAAAGAPSRPLAARAAVCSAGHGAPLFLA